MKKQINPTIKAHLIRSAFYLLLLLAVCAIPFALASRSRGTAKQSVAQPAAKPNVAANMSLAQAGQSADGVVRAPARPKISAPAATDISKAPKLPRTSQIPLANTGVIAAHVVHVPSAPKAPQVILYDQYDNLGTNATWSGTLTDFVGFDADLADDFVVPGGQTWNVESIDADGVYFGGSGPANSFNVFIYVDSGGLPGTQVYSTLNQTWTQVGSTFTVNLSPAAVLTPGTYWIEIQANMTFSVGGQWGWTDRTVQSNSAAAWQNPGGGFGTPCTTWGQRGSTCGIDPGVPDQVYRINGTIVTGTPTPTPTASPSATATPTGTPTCNPAWQNEPNMLASRAFASAAAANNAFYVLTGYDGVSPYVTETDYFNGSTWATGAPIPVPHSQSKAAAVGNSIYVPGGYNFGQINNMQIYDTVANTWSNGAPLPDNRAGSATAAFNGKVYIIGGYDATFTAQNQVWEYDPVANTYTTKTPMPAPSGNVPGALLGNEIFVVGGAAPTPAAYAYNPATDTWRSLTPPSPTDCQAGGAFPLNGQLWLVGCLGQDGTVANVYDPVSDTWSLGPPLNTSQEGGSATAVYNALGFVAGGAAGGNPSTTVESIGGPCGSPTPHPTATAPPTASPSCTPASFQVLIVSSDLGVQPVMLHDQIAAEPGVTTVDYFDAEFATPTLGQLQPYNIVVAFSDSTYSDPTGMGDVLADYADAGGIVVGFMFNWYGPPFDLEGRWQTDGYSPFVDGVGSNFGTNCLGTYDMTHPLMQGISAGSLCAFFRNTLALTPGAVSVAEYQDGEHLCAYQVHNGHTGVGINAYVGDLADTWMGPFGRVVVNAGRWLISSPCGTPTPTPTATFTPTPTATFTPTPTATATATFTPTPTATATATPTPLRPTPTPRPRPTPPPRP